MTEDHRRPVVRLKPPFEFHKILDEATMRRLSENSSKAIKLFGEQYDALFEEHAGKWVIFSRNGLEEMADSMEEVVELWDARGEPDGRRGIILRYIHPEPHLLAW